MDAWMTETMTALAEHGGYAGFALLMLLQDVFPPIPSELVLVLAGVAASKGGLNPVLLVLVCGFGSLVGMLGWYGIGRWVGIERLAAWAGRHGRWLTMTPDEVRKMDVWFDRYGKWAVAGARIVPAVGALIAVPAGMAGMPLGQFIRYAGAGSLVYAAVGVGGVWWLGEQNWPLVEKVLGPLGSVVLGGLLTVYLWRVARFKPVG